MACDTFGDLRPRSLRFAFLAASFIASLAVPARVEAGGAVVPSDGRTDPNLLDLRVAVSVSPEGTTRWSEVTVPYDPKAVLWLVPAKPGATIAWASHDWLPALEEATAPRILQPYHSSSCNFTTAVERPAPWTISATKQSSPSYVVHTSAASVRNAADADGFAITPEIDARIGTLYAAGWNLVAVRIETPNGSTSSGTLRITDDGGSILPIALTGSRSVDTRVTAWAIGAGVGNVSGARDIDRTALRWGRSGSTFVAWRRDAIQLGDGEVWVREAASHAALFDGTGGNAPTPSVANQYLWGTTCATTADNASASDDVVGSTLPASTFSCGGRDDLAIALDGLAPRTAVVTRFSGMIPRGRLGFDRALTFDVNGSQSQPSVRAGSYEACPNEGSGSTTSPNQPFSPSPSGGTDEVVTEDDSSSTVVYVGDGCSGGTTTTYEETTDTTTTTDEGCGGDTSTTSTSSSDGWDDSDSSDACDSDTSSSSSSDSCSGGSTGGGSNDGWDLEDDMDPSSKKHSLKARPKSSKSPFSRYALFAVALLLPLRRRFRGALERR